MTDHIIKIDGKWYIDLDLFDEKEKEIKILKNRLRRIREILGGDKEK
jgi:uncharacterized phage-like protein YoqJ